MSVAVLVGVYVAVGVFGLVAVGVRETLGVWVAVGDILVVGVGVLVGKEAFNDSRTKGR